VKISCSNERTSNLAVKTQILWLSSKFRGPRKTVGPSYHCLIVEPLHVMQANMSSRGGSLLDRFRAVVIMGEMARSGDMVHGSMSRPSSSSSSFMRNSGRQSVTSYNN